MREKNTTARLIATVIRARLEQGVGFGLLAASLPPFDLNTFYTALQPDLSFVRIALLGFGASADQLPPEVARDIETVVSWRNEDNPTVKIVVILNPTAQIEKTHSLGMFEPFSDTELRLAICRFAQSEAQSESQFLQSKVWLALQQLEKAGTQRLPIVAKQLAEFYHALKELQSNESTSLPYLGLLPDESLRPTDNVLDKLRQNRRLVEWLAGLDETAFRKLARAASGDSDDFGQTFRYIKDYRNKPGRETLQKLSVQAILAIQQAPKESTKRHQRSRGPVSADQYLTNQFLAIASEQDSVKQQEAFRRLEEQASHISQLFFQQLPDDFGQELPKDTSRNEPNSDFVMLLDPYTGEEAGRADSFTEDDKAHPLAELFQEWVRPLSWGGQVEAEIVDATQLNLPRLFKGEISLRFTPLRPLDTSAESSLLSIFRQLDEVISETGQTGRLVELLERLSLHRRALTAYQLQFLYYPQFATLATEVSSHLRAYLEIYQELSKYLNEVGRQLQEMYPDAVSRAIAQFLALDTIRVNLNYVGRPTEVRVLLTSLHPLHVWKWVRLVDYLYNVSRPFTIQEQVTISQALRQIPTLLNTFVLHPAMYDDAGVQTEHRLVLGGEIYNDNNDATVGIPYYEPQAERTAGEDGIEEATQLFSRFLLMYPPAQLGLTLVLIDPPRLSGMLKALVTLHRGNEIFQLQGAKVFVFWTKTSSYDDWQSRDEEALELFRTNPRWMLYIDLETRLLDKIPDELLLRNVHPHIILLFDPSAAVARSTFRTVQDDANPFGIPVQLSYDKIRNRLRVDTIATGGLFDEYGSLRSILTGDTPRTLIGTGSRGATIEEVRKLLNGGPATHWLIILDWLQGSLELPTDIGKRLVWLPVGARTLTVYTKDEDWQIQWGKHLNHFFDDENYTISPAIVLDSLLELVPLSETGLTKLINTKSTTYTDVLDKSTLATLLSALAIRNWYRHEHPGVVLLPIGGKDFANWYGTVDISNNPLPYYLVMWPDGEDIGIDFVAVRTGTNPTFLASDVERLIAFARTLETLFSLDASTSILTPIRRDLLRERLTGSVFAPSSTRDESIVSQTRQTKGLWAIAINRLFTLARNTPSRILQITVALHDTTSREVSVQPGLGVEENEYQCLQVVLPGTWLQLKETAEVKDITEVAETPQPSEPTGAVVPDASGPPQISEPAATEAQLVSANPSMAVRTQAARLQRVLEAYGLAISGVDAAKSQIGPRFIRYWIQLQPPAGRLSEVQKYAEDIAREMGSRTVPLIDNIPGERYIGIDLARDEPTTVYLKAAVERLSSASNNQLLIAAGQNSAGDDIQLDIARLPHMLVAGQTGSGKTVFLSSLVTSLVSHKTASELQLLLVDPKQMDFGIFSDLPHLVDNRILYEPEEAVEALRNLLQVERPRRTEILRQAGCPNILEYNRRNPATPLPWLVVVIDEFADLILGVGRREREEFERQINRLAATGRAVGIHLVIATQRPTTDIITGTIKANITARISFRLPSQVDSRTILDRTGAENLLGQGDMLVSLESGVQRLQGYYADFEEFRDLLSHAKR